MLIVTFARTFYRQRLRLACMLTSWSVVIGHSLSDSVQSTKDLVLLRARRANAGAFCISQPCGPSARHLANLCPGASNFVIL